MELRDTLSRDFCFWHDRYNTAYHYETSCDKTIDFENYSRIEKGFLFCPFCGRLIAEKEEGNL
jgi:hypothetical protein